MTRRFYPALDGVRGIAALLVFLRHFGGVTVGWIGVDVFFVLSGFLITSVLVQARDEPHRYRHFYIRRALRIFPVYYLALAGAAVVGVLTGVTRWPSQLLWWPAYVGNFLESVFFTAQFAWIGTLWVGHFWSLCVEEQFYLAWPLLIFSLRDPQRIERAALTIVIGVATARAVLAFALPPVFLSADWLYELTPFRIDALAAGAWIGARVQDGRPPTLASARRLGLTAWSAFAVCCVIGVAVSGPSALDLNARWMTAFGYPLLAAGSVGLVAMCLHEDATLSRVLEAPVLQRLGQVSYGFYLLNMLVGPFNMLVSWATPAAGSLDAARWLLLPVALSVNYVVARLSFRFVEQPCLALRTRFAPDHVRSVDAVRERMPSISSNVPKTPSARV